MSETLVLKFTSREMGMRPRERSTHATAKLAEIVGDTAVFEGDYTVVPVEGGVVVSKQEGPFFYDVVAKNGEIWGRNIRPTDFRISSDLSPATCESLAVGALVALGCTIVTPPDHSLRVR